jgi:hypothetical protein
LLQHPERHRPDDAYQHCAVRPALNVLTELVWPSLNEVLFMAACASFSGASRAGYCH